VTDILSISGYYFQNIIMNMKEVILILMHFLKKLHLNLLIKY